MKSLITKFHKSKFLGRVVHTLDYCIQNELRDCKSVLDLGCGPSSPLQYCKNIKYSIGVEAFLPYLEESKKKNIHSEYLDKKIEDLNFPENSFDAVIMIEVLEHLPKEVGVEILKKSSKWAKKKIIVSTPNGYFPMDAVDGNEHQRHLSGWSVDVFKRIGFSVRGMSGVKFLYHNKNTVHSLINKDAIFSNIRFKPKQFFYLINGLLQIGAYYFPKCAFGLLAVKTKK
jgi:2-polyprenyl-3-methyl-5-hydroxy-6-metoxy-1,4-benzoquinol methylase